MNYATEQATVDFDAAAVAPEDLVAAVEAAGYEAVLPAAAREPGTADGGAGPDRAAAPPAARSRPCSRCPCCCSR